VVREHYCISGRERESRIGEESRRNMYERREESRSREEEEGTR
jgi:hypothetical protein